MAVPGRTGLLEFSRAFSAPVWILLAGDLIAWIGYGLVLPFEVIYLTTVRGFDPALAGLIVGLQPTVSLLASPVVGEVADRHGPRRLLAPALLATGGGAFFMSLATTPGGAATAALVMGVGFSTFGIAIPTLVAVAVPPSVRSSAFSMRYAGMNLGLTFGVFLGALFATDPSTGIPRLFQLEAAVFGICAIVVPLSASRIDVPKTGSALGHSLGWSYLVRDRTFASVWAISFLVRAFAIGQISSGLPLLAVGWLQLHPQEFAIAVGGNTIMVAVAQLPALRVLRSRRRSSALVALALDLTVVWLDIAIGILAPSHVTRIIAISLAGLLIGLGETVLPATIPPLTNDLAPDSLRARYNAAAGVASYLGFAIGPVAAGTALQLGGPAAYLTVMLLASLAIGVLARQLGPRLTVAQNTIG